MKTLSVMVPWPWLIIYKGKDVENRTWKTDYRGCILIHASKKPDPRFWKMMNDLIAANILKEELAKTQKLCGLIIGSVELADCVQGYDSPWAEPGMWHWVLRDPQPLEKPIPARGALGLWEYQAVKHG